MNVLRISVWVAWFCVLAVSSAASERPNVVFILVDDLGWSDVGCYGSDFFETPRIDAFAEKGIKFANAYAAAPVCSPTRAAIMTGKHPARLDMTIWHEGAVGGGPRNRRLRDAPAVANLPHDELTMAEVFRSAGYFTAHVGKWHLGTAAYYPETQGYDLNIGGTFWGAPTTFFFPFAGPWSRNNPEFRYVPGLAPGQPGDYLPDRLTDKAIEIIDSNAGSPFFLSLWFHTVHSPIEAPDELIRKYEAKEPGRIHKDATYAAMVERMDHNVGRVLDKLEETGLLSETIVVITSDNGGVDFDQRGIVPTSNYPLRSGKGTLYEGGTRVPLLIHWPRKPLGERAQMVRSEDFLPTFAEFLHDSGLSSERTHPEDGESLMSVLDNPDARLERRAMFWHFPHYYPRMTPASSVRRENWKLIHYYEDDRLELFDLASDPAEQNNLVSGRKQLASDLKRQLDAWRQDVGANEPLPQE